MRTFLRTLALALVAVLIASCGEGGTAGGDRAATVNGHDISRALLERVVEAELAAAPEPLEGDELAEQTQEIQRAILSALINFRIVADLAEEEGVEPSEDELEEALEEEIEISGGEEAFDGFLEQIGLSREEYRDLIVANNVRRERLAEAVAGELSEDDLREAYELQRETRYETRTARHILVESQEEADDVVAQLEEGADFAELAAEVSVDPGSGEQGGDLGPQPRGAFVPEFDEAVWESELDELLGPIESDFGFHIIEVTDEELREFDEVRDELQAELQAGEGEAALEALIIEATDEADVDVAPGLGEWDPAIGQVVETGRVGEGPAPGEMPEGELPDGELDLEGMTEEELLEQLEQLQELEQGEPSAP